MGRRPLKILTGFKSDALLRKISLHQQDASLKPISVFLVQSLFITSLIGALCAARLRPLCKVDTFVFFRKNQVFSGQYNCPWMRSWETEDAPVGSRAHMYGKKKHICANKKPILRKKKSDRAHSPYLLLNR